MDLHFPDIVKYGVLAILIIIGWYIGLRISASAIFRSYFEQKKKQLGLDSSEKKEKR